MKIISQNQLPNTDKNNRQSEIVERQVEFECFDSCTLSSKKIVKELGPAVGWTYAICFIDDEGNKTEGRITNENKKYYEVNDDLLDKLQVFDSTAVYRRIDEDASEDEQDYSTESNSPEFVKLLEEYFPMNKK